MDSTNKVLALFVGLFVVILLIGIGLSRLAKDNKPLKGSLGNIFTSKTTPTPTPTKKPSVLTISVPSPIVSYTTQDNSRGPASIPETGATSLPLLATTFLSGFALLKVSKRS